MKKKILIVLFPFLSIHALAFAFFGQIETKRERRERETTSSILPADAYERIQESFLREDYAGTVKLSETYLSKGDRARFDDVSYLESLSLLKLNRTSEARDKLKTLEASALSEDLRAQAAVSVGDSYYLANDTFLAIQSYETALKKYPHAAEAPYVQGRLAELSSRPGNPASNFLTNKTLKTPSSRSTPISLVNKPASLHQIFVEESPFYTVQVGSFSRERNARSLIKKLSRLHYEAYIDSYLHDRMYRVRVGKVATHEAAESLETRLRKDGYPTKIYP